MKSMKRSNKYSRRRNGDVGESRSEIRIQYTLDLEFYLRLASIKAIVAAS